MLASNAAQYSRGRLESTGGEMSCDLNWRRLMRRLFMARFTRYPSKKLSVLNQAILRLTAISSLKRACACPWLGATYRLNEVLKTTFTHPRLSFFSATMAGHAAIPKEALMASGRIYVKSIK